MEKRLRHEPMKPTDKKDPNESKLPAVANEKDADDAEQRQSATKRDIGMPRGRHVHLRHQSGKCKLG